MAATITEAPAGASAVARRLLELEPGPLSASEAQALVADFIARAGAAPRARRSARACHCRRPWEFERGHCSACGLDLAAGERRPS